MAESIELILRGKIPSKKNRYTPRKGGRGFFKDSTLQTEIDRLALQIPADVRDLKLESPDIFVEFTYVKANWDRDNAWVCLSDILVDYGILAGDNLAHCNGRIVIEPAVRGEYDSVKITLVPKEHHMGLKLPMAKARGFTVQHRAPPTAEVLYRLPVRLGLSAFPAARIFRPSVRMFRAALRSRSR